MVIDIDAIMRRSSKAICGTFEREVLVDEEDVAAIKKALRSKGQMIVGTGQGGTGKKKIWFNPKGISF